MKNPKVKSKQYQLYVQLVVDLGGVHPACAPLWTKVSLIS